MSTKKRDKACWLDTSEDDIRRLFCSRAHPLLRRGYPSSGSPSQKPLWKVWGSWFSLSHLGLRLSINEVNGKWRISVVYSSLAIHVLTASSIALDKSPFLPPNFSIVLNLSSFSNLSGISTYICPISTPSTIKSANELYFSSSIWELHAWLYSFFLTSKNIYAGFAPVR